MRRPIPDLKYVQVQKKRGEKGRLLEINTRIVFGAIQDIERVFRDSERCKTINTVFVESRNGKFRKDDARFKQKYHHRTPAMAQKIIDKPLSVKELLMWRPQLSP